MADPGTPTLMASISFLMSFSVLTTSRVNRSRSVSWVAAGSVSEDQLADWFKKNSLVKA